MAKNKPVDDVWTRLIGLTSENKALLKNKWGIDYDTIDDMQDDERYLYLPLRVMLCGGSGNVTRQSLLIIMGENHVVTLQEDADFPPFSSAFLHIRRHPEALGSPEALVCLLLHVLNEQAGKVINRLGRSLEEMSDTISEVTRTLNRKDNTLGISDIYETMVELNKKEQDISRTLESQLALARAARYLDMEVLPTDSLQPFIRTLRDDIASVKEHTVSESGTVRYLQNAVLGSLNVKQNQIVKIFTIITAVFLPPTLIASIYGMNFSMMPELQWEHGFLYSVLLMLFVALLPLLYIKYRGWLR